MKLLNVSKFTYKNVSKDQKFSDFENLSFKWKSTLISICKNEIIAKL